MRSRGMKPIDAGQGQGARPDRPLLREQPRPRSAIATAQEIAGVVVSYVQSLVSIDVPSNHMIGRGTLRFLPFSCACQAWREFSLIRAISRSSWRSFAVSLMEGGHGLGAEKRECAECQREGCSGDGEEEEEEEEEEIIWEEARIG